MITAIEQLKAACPTVSVGVLTADLLNLGSELRMLEDTGVSVAHVDVMDGVFCPAMTVGPPFVRAIKTPLLKDVHLMIADPVSKVPAYAAAGADIITVHVESTPDATAALKALGELENTNDPARGIVRGIGLNPDTELSAVEPLLDDVDMIVVLAVQPGISGQSFATETPERIARLRAMTAGRETLLCVDGGVKKDNIAAVAETGADLIVTGSAVFDGKDAPENARFMLEAIRR